jgi:hypothetical protein
MISKMIENGLRSRVQTGRWSTLWGWPGLVVGLTVGLAACGGGGLPGDRIAQSIQDDVIKQGGTSLKSVTCPKTIKPESGASFECIGEIETGYTFTIAVKQSDDKGNVVWDVPSAKGLLNVAKLQTLIQESLQSELGTRPVVDCGGTYKAIKPGQTFDCKLDYKQPDPKKDAAGKDAAGKDAAGDKPATDVASTPQKATPDATPGKSGKPGKSKPEKIVVTIDPQNNLSWQRVLPDAGVKVAAATPGGKSATASGGAATDANAAPIAAPPAKASAEEFLNQPNATESLED